MVDKCQWNRVRIHVQFPSARTVKERLAIEVHHLARRTIDVRMESKRITYIQIHFGISEIAVVQAHRVDMDSGVDVRVG